MYFDFQFPLCQSNICKIDTHLPYSFWTLSTCFLQLLILFSYADNSTLHVHFQPNSPSNNELYNNVMFIIQEESIKTYFFLIIEYSTTYLYYTGLLTVFVRNSFLIHFWQFPNQLEVYFVCALSLFSCKSRELLNLPSVHY